MSDYINREMAADCIVLECDDVTLEQARQAIKDCPSADVVKVVRCKDCKHWNKDAERNDGYGYCSYWQRFIAQAASEDIQTYKDAFCSYGERKDDGSKNSK